RFDAHETSTSTSVGACPLRTSDGLLYDRCPSTHTSNVMEAELTSSSAPTYALNVLHLPPSPNVTLELACTPRPLSSVVPPIEIGRPSPAAAPPLLVSLSIGPSPLVGVPSQLRSLSSYSSVAPEAHRSASPDAAPPDPAEPSSSNPPPVP